MRALLRNCVQSGIAKTSASPIGIEKLCTAFTAPMLKRVYVFVLNVCVISFYFSLSSFRFQWDSEKTISLFIPPLCRPFSICCCSFVFAAALAHISLILYNYFYFKRESLHKTRFPAIFCMPKNCSQRPFIWLQPFSCVRALSLSLSLLHSDQFKICYVLGGGVGWCYFISLIPHGRLILFFFSTVSSLTILLLFFVLFCSCSHCNFNDICAGVVFASIFISRCSSPLNTFFIPNEFN